MTAAGTLGTADGLLISPAANGIPLMSSVISLLRLCVSAFKSLHRPQGTAH